MKNGTGRDLELPIDIVEADEEALRVDAKSGADGFLPIQTNLFDRFFISIVVWIALTLLWMRFIELSLPLWIANVIALALAILIIRKG